MDKKIANHVAKLLLDSQSIMINTKEPFTYTSGKIGPTYCDMRVLYHCLPNAKSSWIMRRS